MEAPALLYMLVMLVLKNSLSDTCVRAEEKELVVSAGTSVPGGGVDIYLVSVGIYVPGGGVDVYL